MNNINHVNKEFKKRTTKNGVYVFVVSVVLALALIGLNLLVTLLPQRIVSIDTSPNKMYSISDNTKRTLSGIRESVNMYLITLNGEDSLSNEENQTKIFFENYASFSPKISFSVIDLSKNPTLITKYGLDASTTTNLTLIVESDLRFRVINGSDLFFYYLEDYGRLTEEEAALVYSYYGYSPSRYFDGESLALSALDYVLSDDLPTAYTLSGHGEVSLSSTVFSNFDSMNVNLQSLALMMTGKVPDDCDLLIVNIPENDISSEEATAISEYLEKGGKMLLTTENGISDKVNLSSVVGLYGLSSNDGIIIEGDSNRYYQYPYYLFPNVMSDHEMTAENASSKYILLPFSHGISVSEALPSDIRVTPLFTTSDSSYIVDSSSESIEKPEGQEAASYNIGVVAESISSGATVVWVSSPYLTSDQANSITAGGNYSYLMSAVSYMCAPESIAYESPVSLDTARLTVSAGSAGVWAIIFIIVIPITILVGGLVYWNRRRKK